jgi:hypothetical protein
VLACVERVNGDKAVGAVGGKNVNDVNVLVLDNLVVVGGYIFIALTEFSASLDSALLNDITESDDLKIFLLYESGKVLVVGDAAASDDSGAKNSVVHSPFSPLCIGNYGVTPFIL